MLFLVATGCEGSNTSEILLVKAVASERLADTAAADALDSRTSLDASEFNAADSSRRGWPDIDEELPSAEHNASAASRIFAAAASIAKVAAATAADASDMLAAAAAADATAQLDRVVEVK